MMLAGFPESDALDSDLQEVKMRVQFRIFHGMTVSWEQLFGDAARFASQIPPDRLINISHSCDKSQGVVTVWYWGTD